MAAGTIGRYLDAIDAGDIDPRARVLTVSETPAVAVLDGSRAVGHVAATKAMTIAIEKAKDVGTGTVAVGNSQHLGAASVYALMAAREGLIGFCTTSTGRPTVAAFGSAQPPSPTTLWPGLCRWGMTNRSFSIWRAVRPPGERWNP